MPKKIRIDGVVHTFPDDFTDQDIQTALASESAPKAPATPPQPPSWAERLAARTGGIVGRDQYSRAMIDLGEGAFSTGAKMIYEPADILNRKFGFERQIEKPEVQRMMTSPETAAGQAGKYGAMLAANVIPGMQVTKGLQGAGLATRIGTEALVGGAQSALQSGGDRYAVTLGTLTGGLGGYLGGRFQAMRPTDASQQAVQYISDIGGRPSLGTRWASPFLQAVEKGLAYTPGGAWITKRAGKKTTEALGQAAENFLEQAHAGVNVSPFEAGYSAREGLGKAVKGYFERARDNYRAWNDAIADPANVKRVQTGVEQVATGVLDAAGKPVTVTKPILEEIALPVDIRPLQKNMQATFDEINEFWTFDRIQRSKGFPALRTLISSKGIVPAKKAESALSSLKEFVRENPKDAIANQLVSQLQARVDAAARQAGPDVLAGLREGRRWTAVGEEVTEDVLEKLAGKEPKFVYDFLTRGGEGSLEYLQRFAKEAPAELTKLGRGYLEEVFNIATREGAGFSPVRGAKMFNDWQSLGSETKKLLYPNPLLRENLDKFFLGMKKLAENPNPSGTAGTVLASLQGGVLLTNPATLVQYTLGSGALAAALYSPRASKLLTQAMTTPVVQQARAAGLFRQLARVLGTQALTPAPATP